MSNDAPCRLPQKPLAWMSALKLSVQLAEDGVISSPLSDNNEGSIYRDVMTHLLQQICLYSLWRMKVKSPCQQIMAWSILYEFPHTQWLRILANCQPYLRQSASLYSCLFKWKPCSWSGRAVKAIINILLVSRPLVQQKLMRAGYYYSWLPNLTTWLLY